MAISGQPLTYDKGTREKTAVTPSNSCPFTNVKVALPFSFISKARRKVELVWFSVVQNPDVLQYH